MFHIPQCSIRNRNVHISVLHGALWDMEQVHSGICELDQFQQWCQVAECIKSTGHPVQGFFFKTWRCMAQLICEQTFSLLDYVTKRRMPGFEFWLFQRTTTWIHLIRNHFPIPTHNKNKTSNMYTTRARGSSIPTGKSSGLNARSSRGRVIKFTFMFDDPRWLSRFVGGHLVWRRVGS